jgi:plasmid replication initiation protein
MAQLKERVLELAIKQINEHTDIIVTYKQHKAGRVITGLSFAFTQKKQSIDVTPKPKKLKPTEDLNTLLHDKKFLEKHARAGESWDDVRSRLKAEAETGKFSLT